MSFLKKIIREPLVHFLAAGLLLFVFWGYWGGAANDNKTIAVDKKALTEMLQFESKAFNDEYFGNKFAALSEAEKQDLIKQYVREEALYREALRLGLNKNDYVIKRRVNQKVEFLFDNLAEADAPPPTDEKLQAFYEANKNRYAKPGLFTFTHIFFKAANEAAFAAARKRAEALLKQTQNAPIKFEDSVKHGDRFLYHANYIDRDFEFIASQFGKPFAEEVRQLTPHETAWSQPVVSEHGVHLVLLTGKQTAGFMPLAEVKEKVRQDWQIENTNQAREKKIAELIKQYDVQVKL